MADLDQHQQETPGEESGATRRNASSADMGAPEVIEVEVERLGVRPSAMKAMSGRVWNAVGPVVLAVFIDAGDFLTGGPLIFLGVPLGMLAGYVFSGFFGISPTWRIAITMLTGLYWVAPMTGLLPFATVTAAVMQVVAPGKLREEPFGAPR